MDSVPYSDAPSTVSYDEVHVDLIGNHTPTRVLAANGVLAKLVYAGEGVVLEDGEYIEGEDVEPDTEG